MNYYEIHTGILNKMGADCANHFISRVIDNRVAPQPLFEGSTYTKQNLQEQVDQRFSTTCRVLIDALVITLRPQAEPDDNKLVALLPIASDICGGENKLLLAELILEVTTAMPENGTLVKRRQLKQVAADLLAASKAPLPPLTTGKREILERMLLYLARKQGLQHTESVEALLNTPENVIVDGAFKNTVVLEIAAHRSLMEAENELLRRLILNDMGPGIAEREFRA